MRCRTVDSFGGARRVTGVGPALGLGFGFGLLAVVATGGLTAWRDAWFSLNALTFLVCR